MEKTNETNFLPVTACSLVEGLAGEVSASLRNKQGHFYQLYAIPLSKYLQRRFDYDPGSADDIVHDFLLKRFLLPNPTESLAGKYLRRLGITYIARSQVSAVRMGLSTHLISYLAKLGASKLAGDKTTKLIPPDEFHLAMVSLGGEHFAEIRQFAGSRSFRGYLLRALYHFAVDQLREKSSYQKLDDRFPPIAPQDEPDEHDEAAILLDQFVAIFHKAIDTCRNSSKNVAVNWDIFDAYIVNPAVLGESQPSMGQIAICFRDAIIQSATGERRNLEWNDEQLEKAARNRLDAIRRKLWQEVDRLIETEIPESLRPDLHETVSSNGRNHLLQYYFRNCQSSPHSYADSNAPFAKYLATFLEEEPSISPTEIPLDDLRRNWLQTISQPLYLTLAELGVPNALQYQGTVEYDGAALFNLEHCLRHPSPPNDLMVAIKDSTKSIGKQTSKSGKHPLEFAMVLYALSVALMQCRHGQWISSKSPTEFVKVFDTVLSFEWLDQESRKLILQCLDDHLPAKSCEPKTTKA